ncbi:MAG: 2TM domain-containing protein [Actinomycetota bacterium]
MEEQRAHVDDGLRDRALERIANKQEFYAHLLAYVLVNGLLVGIWAVTGAAFFWPVFPLLGWGIGLGFHAWDTYRIGDPTEDQIQREMEHLRHHQA